MIAEPCDEDELPTILLGRVALSASSISSLTSFVDFVSLFDLSVTLSELFRFCLRLLWLTLPFEFCGVASSCPSITIQQSSSPSSLFPSMERSCLVDLLEGFPLSFPFPFDTMVAPSLEAPTHMLWVSPLSDRGVDLKKDLRVTGAVMAFFTSLGLTGDSTSTVESFF